MQTKFAFKLNQITDNGVQYDDSFIKPLEKYIDESGMIFMYNGSDDFLDYTKDDFIGVIKSFLVKNDIITLTFDVLNKKYNALQNLDLVLSMPLATGTINEESKVINVDIIDAIVVMM